MMPVDRQMEKEWLSEREQRINEAEALAALAFLHTFRALLHGVDLLLFVDSSASEGVLIKNYSSSPILGMISAAFWEEALGNSVGVFIVRVASALNLSDSFSRGDESIGVEKKWARHAPSLPSSTRWAFLRQCFGRHVEAQRRKADLKKNRQQAAKHS